MTDRTEPKMTNFLRGRKPEKHTRRIWVGWKMKGFQWELQNKNNTDLIKHTKQKLTNRISESSNGDCATIRYNIKGDIIGEFIHSNLVPFIEMCFGFTLSFRIRQHRL